MAEESKEQENQQKKEQDKKITPVCSLSVPTIITALHQNALSHCDAASKGMRIINSAINDDKDAELKSAGEHIISAVPLDKDKTIQKKDAIATLKNYVQWFVGPDLANKINDSTVKSLLETPGAKEAESKQTNASSSEAADDEVEDSNDDDLKESFKLTFSQYLLCESGDDSDDEIGEGDDEDDDSGEGSDDDDDSGDGDDDSDDNSGEGKTDEKVESHIGYYIAYNLKVDGLKSTALKDAMKKFAATLFDDLTIKADGLFGGGQSFTIGDVKKAIKGLFGGVDGGKLKSELSKALEKKYDGTSVSTLSKEKTLRKYKSDLDVKQKAAIDKADNSLIITVPPPSSKEVNPRIIADLVTSSIKGLFKKFKHQIKKDDIIVISKESSKPFSSNSNNDDDSYDDDTDKKKELNIPHPEKFESQFASGSSYKDAYDSITKLMTDVKAHEEFGKNIFAKTVYDEWQKWLSDHLEQAQNNKKLDDNSVKILKKHIEPFITAYKDAYNKRKAEKEKEAKEKTTTYDKEGKKINEVDDLINNIILESVRRRFYGNLDRVKRTNALKNEILDILINKDLALFEDEEEEMNADDKDADIGGDMEGEDSSDEKSSAKKEEQKMTTDTYIIPMPGLKDDSDD